MAGKKKVISVLMADEEIVNKIYFIRGQKVMLDRYLAEMYGIETKQLKRQVKRNLDRFPEDFMFKLSEVELKILRSQFGTLQSGSHFRYAPLAFTEHGVLMLSSVVNSQMAIQVNITIMRVYSKMKSLLAANKDILLKLEKLERTTDKNNEDIQVIFKQLKKLLQPEALPRTKIGYKISTQKQ